MSIIVNTNMPSIIGIKALSKNTNAMNKALERMSTGNRINSSKDDAAGDAITTELQKEISSLTAAQSNAQMGQSMIDTANDSIKNISSMLHRIRDLAEQSANGTYGDEERNAMQTEASNLIQEIYRIKESTEFNGKKILGSEDVKPTTEEQAIAEGYKIVKTAKELKEALKANDSNCKVMLFADIDLNDLGTDGTGSNWSAVANGSDNFTGTLDGNGYSISNLKINKENEDNQSFLGRTKDATIKNLSLDNVSISGRSNTAALSGTADNITVSDCEVSGTIEGGIRTGGLIAVNSNGSEISGCTTYATVKSDQPLTGGLIAENKDSTVSNCESYANVKGYQNVGGLIGQNYNGTVSDSKSHATVEGTNGVGGLVGGNLNGGKVENCISYANIKGNNVIGGLVGNNEQAEVNNCSSTGNVNGVSNTGGLVGANSNNGTISNSKTTAVVSGTNSLGAFLGVYNSGTLKYNEYCSAVNGSMKPVGYGLDSPSEEQIKNSTNINIEDVIDDDTAVCPINLQVGINNDDESTITVDTGFYMKAFNINLLSEYGAKKSLSKVDKLISTLESKQTELGAASNRLESTLEYQQIQKSTKTSANSLIKDADFAKESSNYVMSEILQQTTAILLSTANQNPNIALKLLNL